MEKDEETEIITAGSTAPCGWSSEVGVEGEATAAAERGVEREAVALTSEENEAGRRSEPPFLSCSFTSGDKSKEPSPLRILLL